MTIEPWPPLIEPAQVPRWVRVRDFVLTLAVWGLFAWWTRGALLLLWDWLSHPMFELTTYPAPDWHRIWKTLAPFLAAAAILVSWLVFWSVRRRPILSLQHDPNQPPPLEAAEQAARFGLGAADVAALRRLSVATVCFEADGRIAREQPFTGGASR